MNNFYVYEWIRLDNNEPFYVGKGQGDRTYSLKDRNKHFHNIVNKVGLENCAVVILHNNLTSDEACEIECWYIHQYKYLGPYNITNQTDGGEGFTGAHTEESRRKMSEAQSREKNPMWGRENKWGKHSEEARRKISEALSGEKNPMYGRTGEKNPMAKAIIIIFPDGDKKEFGTIKEASLYLGGVAGNCSVANAVRKLLKGWVPKRGRLKGYEVKRAE